jgi:long-chain acyl-CoA synthetase
LAHDTFPKLARANAERLSAKVAIREKDYGIWQSFTWREYVERAQLIALGLASLGFARGDKTAIVGDNRPELYFTVLATQMLGGVPVPLYQDSIEKEMAFVVDHAEARFAIAEDQEQVDKLLHVKARCPRLEHVVYDDPRGMRAYREPYLISLADLMERGRRFGSEHPTFLDDEIRKGTPDDVAIMLYTSGTTGTPKGTMLTHRNLVETARSAVAAEGLSRDEETLAYLPMAWAGDHMFSYAQSMVTGFTVNCPESASTVLADLKEIGPTYFFAPPRIWESILTNVMIRIEDASWLKRRMVHTFLDLGQRIERRRLAGQAVPGWWPLVRPIGSLLVYGPLRDNLGLRRIRIAYTAGEAIGPEIFRFYRALGINLKQLYGQTEASVYITAQPDGEIFADTVGKPNIDVDVKIAESGEVLFKSPGVFLGYYKDPEKTAETKTPDGWVRTGDAGFFDPKTGHLKIIDRAKDVGRLKDGTLFAPKYIENKLKFYPNIKEAVAIGDGRDDVTVMLNIDLVAVGSWAERNGVVYGSYQELAGHPKVYEMLEKHVDEVNRSLVEEQVMARAQIKRFLVLHKELDADDGELTRTMKIRRGLIADRYATLVKALYDGAKIADISTEMTFEDGRKGILSARVAIRDMKTYPVPAKPLEQAA